MRNGCTRSDLVTAVLLGGLCLGLFLPAVGRAREKSNRVVCDERLATIGKGVAAYESARGTLPKAGYWGANNERYGGWGVTLLPYIGEEALSKKYDYEKSWWEAENQAVVRTTVATYQSPFSPAAKMIPLRGPGGGAADIKDRLGAPGDFMVPRGFTDKRVAPDGQFGPLGALGWFNETPRRADITDGSATTILVTEQAGRWAYYKFDKAQPTFDGQEYAKWDGPWASYNAMWVRSGSDDGSDAPGSCIINCNNSKGLYSFNPDGVSALFADGSVRLLKTGMDYRVVYALISRAGGEVVGPGDY